MSTRSSQAEKKGRRSTTVTVNFSDRLELTRRNVEWTPHGVSLLTKWPFAVGTEIEFAFDHDGNRHGCTGIVVSCQPEDRRPGVYATVLYFVEAPCADLMRAACDCRLWEGNENLQG